MRLDLGVLLALASAISAQHVVNFPIVRGAPGYKVHLPPPIAKRSTFTETLANNISGGAYYAEVTVGTPGQTVSLVLDTGSSDAWVVSEDADLCRSTRLQATYGDSCSNTYNSDDSSTYELVDASGFSIQYLDGSVAAGDYITDDFTIGDKTIKGLQMGLARQTVRGVGILGVGYPENVASQTKYPNIIDQLFEQELIDSKAFSLYLNDRRSDEGNILFGGLDKDKFIGSLEILPVIKPRGSDTPVHFEVSFSGMTVKRSDDSSIDIGASSSKDTITAILDSGTTLTYLPEHMTDQLFDELGAITDNVLTGLTFVDCDLLESEQDMLISFTFNNKSVSVPVWEMVLDLVADFQEDLPSAITFNRACVFGIQSGAIFESTGALDSTTDFALIGATFLRSAYVVYDLSHHEIGIAQANLNSTTSDIVELKADDDGLPTATGVASQQITFTPGPSSSSNSDDEENSSSRTFSGTTPSPTTSSGSSDPGPSESGSGSGTVTVTTTPDNAGANIRPTIGGFKGALGVAIISMFFSLVGGALVAL